MYTIYPNRLEALIANAREASIRGCNMTTTKEWFSRINHPTDGRAALADGIGPVTREQMIAEGFIQQPTEVEQ